MYDFEHFPDRRSTESVKWGLFPADVLPMWVADMDFVSPPEVIAALQERVAHGVFGYPMVTQEMKEAVVQRMEARYGWKIDPQDLIFVPGVVPGFNLVCQAFAGAGSSIIMQTPVYPPFLSAPQYAGAERIEVELVREASGRYSVDFEAFERAIRPDTKVFMLCNPHNPVGRVFEQHELERFAEICQRHQVLICSDEIHSDLVFSGHRHIPIASLSEELAMQTVTLIAPSKTFNIAGLECSVIICRNAEYRKQIEHARRGLIGGVNVLGLAAGVSAYRQGDAWLKELLVVLEGNRDLLVNFIQTRLPEIKVSPAEGTYLAWLDCRALNLPQDPCEFFIKEAKVALNNGKEFGQPGQGFVRFNFGCPRSMVQEALERMEQAIRK
jgi:Bifunctional PLP-dependent enzyme with beta-cystathionase and maltose regulon repressor activities